MDKDPLSDRLLERASRPIAKTRTTAACLDAETLAALMDGALTSGQRATAEAHVADCARCLSMVAAMARTDPPPVAAERATWRAWRWLVPLATASVALTTWVLVRDLPPAAPPAAAPVQSATPARSAESAGQPVEQKAEARADDAAEVPPTPLKRERAPARNEAAQKDQSTAARVGAAARTPPATPGPAESTAQTAFRTFAPVLVPSPDPNVQWRVSGSLVERSVDAGRTWVRQTTGTSGVLLAGSSPAPSVCWLVGPGGTVVVTLDGERWRQASFPDPKADIRTVAATSANQAAVTTVDKRTYVTTDGGVTWRVQEEPSTPF